MAKRKKLIMRFFAQILSKLIAADASKSICMMERVTAYIEDSGEYVYPYTVIRVGTVPIHVL